MTLGVFCSGNTALLFGGFFLVHLNSVWTPQKLAVLLARVRFSKTAGNEHVGKLCD